MLCGLCCHEWVNDLVYLERKRGYSIKDGTENTIETIIFIVILLVSFARQFYFYDQMIFNSNL